MRPIPEASKWTVENAINAVLKVWHGYIYQPRSVGRASKPVVNWPQKRFDLESAYNRSEADLYQVVLGQIGSYNYGNKLEEFKCELFLTALTDQQREVYYYNAVCEFEQAGASEAMADMLRMFVLLCLYKGKLSFETSMQLAHSLLATVLDSNCSVTVVACKLLQEQAIAPTSQIIAEALSIDQMRNAPLQFQLSITLPHTFAGKDLHWPFTPYLLRAIQESCRALGNQLPATGANIELTIKVLNNLGGFAAVLVHNLVWDAKRHELRANQPSDTT